jgi:hypothetical protein
MISNDALPRLQRMYCIFPVAGIGFAMEKTRVCIARLEPGNPTSLLSFDF